ncbi:hypothetical protein Gogos_021309, partial [Gossypium gossypioides]|nr:hypothetical protein [Gossypium gossypioides]
MIRDGRDEISLLAEELIQLSIKGSMVEPNSKPTLICTVWTGKLYNPEIFDLEEDLELIMEGRPWLFRKNIILFNRLNQAMERDRISLNSSPFWMKIDSYLPEFDKKDLLHAIGVTFGGVLGSEITDVCCRLRINLDVRKPLRRGIFVSRININKTWVLFKYENLPIYCFECGRMGHEITDCTQKIPARKSKISIDPPYTLALRAESKLVGKESLKFNAMMKKVGVQSSYTGDKVRLVEGSRVVEGEYNEIRGVQENSELMVGEGKLKKQGLYRSMEDEMEDGSKVSECKSVNHEKKKSWKRIKPGATVLQSKIENCMRKRKSPEEDLVRSEKVISETDGTKRLKHDNIDGSGMDFLEVMVDSSEQSDTQNLLRSAAAKRRRCGFPNGIDITAEGSRGGLCLAWKGDIEISLQSYSTNHVDVMVKEGTDEEEWRFTGFYGSPYANNKSDTWNLLKKLGQNRNHPWLVSGDFNEIMYSYEKCGGVPREESRMEAFREVLEEYLLEDLGYSGVWFTWEREICRIQILEKDLTGVWQMTSGSSYSQWAIQNSNSKRSGSWRKRLRKLLKILRSQLIKQLDMLMEQERTDDTMVKILDTKIHLNMEIDKDEVYWEQRARANWLKVGDRNSAFFHRFATYRRKINTILKLELDGGGEVNEASEINEAATMYFQKLFTSSGIGDPSYLLTGIKNNIPAKINRVLMSKFTAEEVYEALRGMDPTKVPGHDGFPAIFFQKYWHIVGTEIANFCLGILNKGENFGPFNQIEIVLIPKIPNPTSLANFRPISLCSVLYKMVAKTIANRLQIGIGRCIDAAQSAFIPGRLITDNVLLAYEILHTFR